MDSQMSEIAKKLPNDTLAMRGELITSSRLIGVDFAQAECALETFGGVPGMMKMCLEIYHHKDTSQRVRWQIVDRMLDLTAKAGLRAEKKQDMASMSDEEIHQEALLLLRE